MTQPGEDAEVPTVVVLAPDRLQAWVWTVVGVTATALAGTATGGRSLGMVAVGLVLLAAVPTAVFAVQALAPAAWTLELSERGVVGLLAGFTVREGFDGLRAVELGGLYGDHTLVLLSATRRRTLLLPVGCDLTGARVLLDRLAARAASPSSAPFADRSSPAQADDLA